MADTTGSALNHQTTVTDAERATLSLLSYEAVPGVSDVKQQIEQTGKWKVIAEPDGSDSGLEIYAVQKVGTDEVVFVTRGSDTDPSWGKDWGPKDGANVAFTGKFHTQHEEAIKFVNKFIEDHKDINGKDSFHYSFAGHSKGGGFSQMLSHIFGFGGTGVDSAPASRVVEHPEMARFLEREGIEVKGMPEHGFVNYNEKGSAVGETLVHLHVGTHLGDTVQVDLVPGSWLSFGSGIQEQHSAFDDALLLASQGELYVLQEAMKQSSQEINGLEQKRAEVAATLERYQLFGSNDREERQFVEDCKRNLREFDQQIETAKEKEQGLQELFLHKVEETYGEPAEDVLERGELEPTADVDSLNILLASERLAAEALSEQISDLEQQQGQNQSDHAAEMLENKIQSLKKELGQTNERIEELDTTLDAINDHQSDTGFATDGSAVNWYWGDEDFGLFATDWDDFSFAEEEDGSWGLERDGATSFYSDQELQELLGLSPDLIGDDFSAPFSSSLLESWQIDDLVADYFGHYPASPFLSSSWGLGLTLLSPDGEPLSLEQKYLVNLWGDSSNFFAEYSLEDTSLALEQFPIEYDWIQWDEDLDGRGLAETGEDGFAFDESSLLVSMFSDPEYFTTLLQNEHSEETIENQVVGDIPTGAEEQAAAHGISGAAEDIPKEGEDVGYFDENGYWVSPDGSKSILLADNSDGMPPWLSAAAISGSAADSNDGAAIDAALDSYFSDLDEQAAEITARQTIAEGRETREEDLAILGTRNDLGEAIDSGDTVSIIAAGFDYLSALDERIDNGPNEGGFLNEEAEAGIDLASTGIKLGQAIDEGEGWDIAKEGLDFTKDLDRYLDNNASTDGFLSNKGASAIGMASAGISLASAIDTGDGLAIAQSGVDLASNINSFAEGSEALGDGLGAVGSAVSLAINIGKIDDVYASGDAGAIAYTTLNTVNNAINTYNYAASALGYANAGLQSVPGLGYIGAAIQLAEGDVQGAAVTAASTYLMTLGPYGWAAAAVLQIANMLLADDSPPQATASFELDANGNVVMSVSGDSEMQAGAASYGNAVMSVMQQYKDGGDRLVIDNSMPSLHVVSGEGVSIEYESEYGGKGHLSITDDMNPVEQMLSVLIARDRGDRLDDAVRMSRVEGGGIDFDQVASILSGYGFTRQGINFTYGEDNSDRIGHAFGTGIFIGGGSAGPEGQLFTARREDIKSLPLREEQLPSQTLGQVLKVSGLNMFAGRGAELLAMAMVFPGLLAAINTTQAAEIESQNGEEAVIVPLNGFELESYLKGDSWMPAPEETTGGGSFHFPVELLNDSEAMQPFLTEYWGELVQTASDTAVVADGVYYFNEDGSIHLSRTGPAAPSDDDGTFSRPSAPREIVLAEAEADSGAGESFSGFQVDATAITESVPPPPEIEQGSFFLMSEDSTLRILASQLAEETLSSEASLGEEQYTFVSLGEATNGRVWREDNGDIRFSPDPDFSGISTFVYTLRSPSGELVERQAVLQVEEVNDAPTPHDDTITLAEGEHLVLSQLLANDSDAEGDTLLIDHLRDVEHGQIVIRDGQAVFVPEPGYSGDIVFSYWVRDNAGSYPAMAMVNITVTDVNDAPAVTNDRFLQLEDSILETTPEKLLANDIEYDGEALSFDGLGQANHGSVEMAADGNIRFIPEKDYSGDEAGFSYYVLDESGNRSEGWVEVDLQAVREAPVVIREEGDPLNENELLVFTPEEIAKYVSDPDGDTVYLEMISNVSHGEIVFRDGYYAFQPDQDYSGPASLDYRASDGYRGVVEGHLDFEIRPGNSPAVTGEDSFTTDEDSRLEITTAELLANDYDRDGTQIELVSIAEATHGNVLLDGEQITFIPEADYAGGDAGFRYTVRDNQGLESVGQVTIHVNAVDDPPVFVTTDLASYEDETVVFDNTTLSRLVRDADGDSLTVSSLEVNSGGSASLENGLYLFTPDPNYHGPASLDLSVQDSSGSTAVSTISLEILEKDDPTEFSENTLKTVEEQPVVTTIGELLAGDTDSDGKLAFTGVEDASNGTVTLSESGEILFTPDQNYFGTDAGFFYTVQDAEGHQGRSWVSVEVAGVEDAPEIIATNISSPEDEQTVFDKETIARFVRDMDGDEITIVAIDDVSGGTVTIENGLYTFIPDQDFHGTAHLTYTASDPQGETVTGVLDLNILSQNDPTEFGNDNLTTSEDSSVRTSVAELMADDSDRDGALEFVGLGDMRHGIASLNGDGTIEFTPTPDYSGDEAGFAYIVRDAEGHKASGWVSVAISPENDVPVITGNRLYLNEDEQLRFTSEEIAKFLYDADGELFQLDMVTDVEGGKIELKDGLYTFIPDKNSYGEASLDYLAVNESGEEVAGSLSLHLSPVNDLPTVPYLALETIEDGEITIRIADLLENSSDVEDGTNLKFGGIEDSINGDAYIDDQGILHFLPDQNFSGAAFLSYKVLDSEGGAGIGHIGIDVQGENDPPVALDDQGITAWSNDQFENVFPAQVFLANDSDPDGDSLTIVSAVNAEFGSVHVDSSGNLHYTAPSDNWVGIDSFTYTIRDGNGAESKAVASIDVKINTSPDVYPELISTTEDVVSILTAAQLLANDSDIDTDVLRIIGVDQAEHCQVELLDDGSILFAPELNYNNNYPGQASFRYTVSDGISEPVSTLAFFDITPVNDRPILQGEMVFGAVEDNDFVFDASDLLANDTDVEMASPYEVDSIQFAGLVGEAGNGFISYDETSGKIFYRPIANFSGKETFSYRVVDSYGAESVVESQIYVEPVNDIPLVQTDKAFDAEDSVWNKYAITELLDNDYDADGDILSISNASASNADVRISGGYLWVKPNFRADNVLVHYTVSDGHGGNVRSSLELEHIHEHNFAPIFTGEYGIGWKNNYTVWFNFHATDKNGGDTWKDWGEIVRPFTPTAIQGGDMEQDGSNAGTGTWKFKGNTEHGSFVFTVRDTHGASSSIYVELSQLSRIDGYHHYTPVVLDLDGDGIELLDLSAGISFDWHDSGKNQGSGWVGTDDGFLVYDYDHDQVVTHADELSFRDYQADAATDLEGLQAFDTNADGVFDSNDLEWESFGVWRDANSNGQTDDGEFSSLADLEIQSIHLQSDENYHLENGNVVYGTTSYEKTDGSTAEVGDVGLNGEKIELQQTGTIEEDENGETTLLAADSENSRETEEPENDTALTDGEQDGISEQETVATAPENDAQEENALAFDEEEISRITIEINSDLASANTGNETFSGEIETTIPEVYITPEETPDAHPDPDSLALC